MSVAEEQSAFTYFQVGNEQQKQQAALALQAYS